MTKKRTNERERERERERDEWDPIAAAAAAAVEVPSVVHIMQKLQKGSIRRPQK